VSRANILGIQMDGLDYWRICRSERWEFEQPAEALRCLGSGGERKPVWLEIASAGALVTVHPVRGGVIR
jgi:hypothetical protein